MGLKDLFRRDRTLEALQERRVTKLEIRQDALEDKWHDFKDIITKQAQRVEKRAQRENGRKPCEEVGDVVLGHQERILARRRLRRGPRHDVSVEG